MNLSRAIRDLKIIEEFMKKEKYAAILRINGKEVFITSKEEKEIRKMLGLSPKTNNYEKRNK